MDTQEARRKFWDTLRTLLKEQGEPFYFAENKQWAVINRDEAFSYHKPCIAMDFLWRKGFLRINVYIENDIPLYNLFKSNKTVIERRLGFKCIWKENTPHTNEKRKFNGDNTRRIEVDLPICTTFSELAKRAIPLTEKFIEVFRGYIDC